MQKKIIFGSKEHVEAIERFFSKYIFYKSVIRFLKLFCAAVEDRNKRKMKNCLIEIIAPNSDYYDLMDKISEKLAVDFPMCSGFNFFKAEYYCKKEMAKMERRYIKLRNPAIIMIMEKLDEELANIRFEIYSA